MMKLKRVHRTLLAAALVCSMTVTPVFAAPEDDQANLEAQKVAVQGEVNALQEQLNSLMTKMNDLESQLIKKGEEIIKAKEDLAAAEEKEEQQYEDMKLRIKYMYEEGDGSAAERILNSGSIAEVLSQAEYVQKVHAYDRDMLNEYVNTVKEVEELKSSLESDMTKLQSLETEYKAQSDEISSTIESKSAEIENIDSMILEAARAAEAARRAEEERQQQQNQQNGGGNANTPVTPNTPNTPSEPVTPPSNNTPADDGTIVGRAYSQIGKPYVWGATGPNSFDCSGLVGYCITGGYGRLGTTYTFMSYPQVSNPQPGDICTNWDHCGIYIGGGQMIHAPQPGESVKIGPVQGGMIFVRYPY